MKYCRNTLKLFRLELYISINPVKALVVRCLLEILQSYHL